MQKGTLLRSLHSSATKAKALKDLVLEPPLR